MQDERYTEQGGGRKRRKTSLEVEVHKIRDDHDEKIELVAFKEEENGREISKRFELRRFATEEKAQKIPLDISDCRSLLIALLDIVELDTNAIKARILVAKGKGTEGVGTETETTKD